MSFTVQSWRTPSASAGARTPSGETGEPVPAAGPTEADAKRRPDTIGVALVVLVLVAVVARFLASLGIHEPWVMPDEAAYSMLGRSFWSTGHAQIVPGVSSSLGLYPYLAGAPQAIFGIGNGLIALKVLQALLVAIPIVIAYVWARPLAGRGWALAAAALTAALPVFVYSGLVMTEVPFLVIVTFVLWRFWRSLLDPSLLNQLIVLAGTAVAIAIRAKAAVLLPSLAIAVVLMAWLVRDSGLVRRFLASALVVGVALVLGVGLAVSSGWAPFGVYGGALGGGYRFSAVVHWIVYEAGDVLVLVVAIPVVAAVALTVSAVRGRASREVRALVAVILPYTVLLVIEVGIYVSKAEDRLNERALVSLAPAFFVALAAWLHEGLHRTRSTIVIALAVAAAACLWPVGKLIDPRIAADSFTPIPLLDLRAQITAQTLRLVWIAFVAVAVGLALLVPRRAALVIPVLIVAVLLTASVFAQLKVNSRAAADRATFFGSASPQWIDHATSSPVVYLDDDPLWQGAWHLAFWNRRIVRTENWESLSGPRLDNFTADPRTDGVIVEHDQPLSQRDVLAPNTITLVGRRVAHIAQGGDEPGLTLWRTPSAPRVSTWVRGTLPEPVSVSAFSCVGALYVDLAAPTQRADAYISVGNPAVSYLVPLTVPVPAGHRLRVAVPSAPGNTPKDMCLYVIRTDGDLQLSDVIFRRGAPPPNQSYANGTTTVIPVRSSPIPGYKPSATPTPPKQLAYCVDGNFQMLPAGPHDGATPAFFVQGTGLTCSIPDGYIQQGYASDGVPPGIYPLYVPPAPA
jgi:hypothetical protein